MLTTHQNSDRTCTILPLLEIQLRDFKDDGGKTLLLQKSELLFYRRLVRVYRGGKM